MAFSTIEVFRQSNVSDDPLLMVAPWTVRVGEQVVTESMFAVNHFDDPVQVSHCPHCGTPWCANGGCVLVRSAAGAIVWMRPWMEPVACGDEGTNYIVGGEPVWLSGADINWISQRYAPLTAVREQPIWFDEEQYRAFLERTVDDPATVLSRIDPLTDGETDYLLRTVLRGLLAGETGQYLSWSDFATGSNVRRIEPADGDLAEDLLAAAERIEHGTRIVELSPTIPQLDARMVESMPGDGAKSVSRLGGRCKAAGDVELWHAVGRGCWGRLSFETC